MPISDALISMLGIAIPIVAIIGGFTVAIVGMYVHYRRQREMLQMYHAERMAAIEKGIELPPLPPELTNADRYGSCGRGRRSSGFIILFVGLALTYALWENGGGWWGLVVVAVGLGRVVESYLDRRHYTRTVENDRPGPGGLG